MSNDKPYCGELEGLDDIDSLADDAWAQFVRERYSMSHSEEPETVSKQDIEALQHLKQKEDEIMDLHRNIKGEPIPEKEVIRGARITKKTLQEELERWRKHPILSKYALTVEEEVKFIAGEQKQ